MLVLASFEQICFWLSLLQEDSAWWQHFQNLPYYSNKSCYSLGSIHSHSYTFISLPFLSQIYYCVNYVVQSNYHCTNFCINRNLTRHLSPTIKASASLHPFKNTEFYLSCLMSCLRWICSINSGSLFLGALKDSYPLLRTSPLCKDWACLVSGSALGTCFVLFIYSHGIKSTLHQK